MKNILATLFTLLACVLYAQTPKPIQIQTIDSSKFVVEYIPIADAQANVEKQLAATEKQLSKVEKDIAELVSKRDALVKQQAALKYLNAQLDQAAKSAAPPPPPVKTPETPPAEKTKKPKKSKN